MRAAAKVTLKGELTVMDRHCNCCNGKDIMVVSVRDTNFNVCADCVEKDCECSGNNVTEVEK